MKTSPPVGIDDMAFAFPQLYFPIPALAELRGLEADKLRLGLGLEKMAIPDVGEDVVTLGATAVKALIDRNQLDPRSIGRLYLGTESAVDGAKPTATFILGLLEEHYAPVYGPACFRHCDVTDLTFACIGAVDALQNTLDWAAAAPDRIGIVLAADVARYDLNSPGEYTQGAGAVALLVKQTPRLLAIEPIWGIATAGVFDFFKPLRIFSKTELRDALYSLEGKTLENKAAFHVNTQNPGVWDHPDAEVHIHRDTPVYDGQYSNRCYIDRMTEAWAHYRRQAEAVGALGEQDAITRRWKALVFHLPYAFHAKRVFPALFRAEEMLAGTGFAAAFSGTAEEQDKQTAKSVAYQAFVADKLESGQRASQQLGNLYTGSIWTALISTLETGATENRLKADDEIGFVAYGSGSKAKVFAGNLMEGWEKVAMQWHLLSGLEKREAIDAQTYEMLHRGLQLSPVAADAGGFRYVGIDTDGVSVGARRYKSLV